MNPLSREGAHYLYTTFLMKRFCPPSGNTRQQVYSHSTTRTLSCNIAGGGPDVP